MSCCASRSPRVCENACEKDWEGIEGGGDGAKEEDPNNKKEKPQNQCKWMGCCLTFSFFGFFLQ